MSEAWEPYDEDQDQRGYGDRSHLEKHEWLGSFVADPDTGQLVVDRDAVHAAIIEEEFAHFDENQEWIDWDALVTGWLYQEHGGGDLVAYFVSLGGETNPWATSPETKQKVMHLISQKYGGRPVQEGYGTISQWNEPGYEAEAKVAYEDTNPDSRPSYWLRFLHDQRDNQIHIWPINPYNFEQGTHSEKLEELGFYDTYGDDYSYDHHEHEDNVQADTSNAYETGYIFNDGTNTAYNPDTKERLNKWYQEHKDTHPYQVTRDWEENPNAQDAYHFAKGLKPHPRRVHVRKHHFHELFGFNPDTRSFIAPDFSVLYPPGGQVDTTLAKLAFDVGTLIKFVSLDDGTFLVGENTHHAYLLESEFKTDTFPATTNAIGRAWLENREITGVGFDFGSASAQAQAIRRLRAWGHEQGYNVAPELEEAIRGLA